jgi:hypothetical protein
LYSFLVLLPLTLISAAVCALVVFSPQVAEYVAYIATLDLQGGWQLPYQIAAHIAAYAIACCVLVATARTISTPVAPERSAILCRVQVVLEAIFVAIPSLILVALPIKAIASPPGWVFWWPVGIGSAGLAAIVFYVWPPGSFRSFQWTVATLVAGLPTTVTAVLLAMSLPGASVGWLLPLIAVVAALGLIVTVATAVLVRRPLEFFRSTLSPLSITKVDLLGALAVAAILGLVASFRLWPVESADFLGIFPVLFMVSATFLLAVSVVFARGSSPVAILSTAVSAIVVMYALEGLLPPREFRYRSEIPPRLAARLAADGNDRLGVDEVTKARGILEMREAFRMWLEVRSPAIDAYRKKGRTYPVFVVTAQGGGVYAAYHSALSLARLYDACPEFANHVFILSGVSGGGLGSAVFAELVRSVPENLRNRPAAASEGCSRLPDAWKLEGKVKAFFKTDFLSPVVGSALVLDMPSLVVPLLRYGSDRAYALEYAFESAWRKAGVDGGAKYGMSAAFYGRWQPDSPAPALVLSTTGVNNGIPVLVSQIAWSQAPRVQLKWRDGAEATQLLRKLQAQDERASDVAIADILDFRPDLQVTTSTAVALSARFPFVTPPANIRRHHRIRTEVSLYEKIDVLELLDGAYIDNSGGWVAVDILEDLERFLRGRWRPDFKAFEKDVRFHLVRFTDRSAQRHGDADDREHFELVSPLVAFDAVRAARGAQLRQAQCELERTGESFVYLLDPWFLPPLNWLLSDATRRQVELRSGGQAPDAEKCCLVVRVAQRREGCRPRRRQRRSDILLVGDWDEARKLMALSDFKAWTLRKFVPDNRETFDRLLRLVREGDEPLAPPKPVPPAQPQNPPQPPPKPPQ